VHISVKCVSEHGNLLLRQRKLAISFQNQCLKGFWLSGPIEKCSWLEGRKELEHLVSDNSTDQHLVCMFVLLA
jgi:hypothetical protein